MVDVEWALICERLELDELGYHTAHRIYSIMAANVPCSATLVAACRIRPNGAKNIAFHVQIERPDGTSVGYPQPSTSDLPNLQFIDLQMRLVDVPLDRVGPYLFHFVIDGTTVKTVLLIVVPHDGTVH
jgi:hypothetical protein